METKIKEIMSVVFQTNIENIENDASAKTIENWDSLNHMRLIIALEQEFSLEFNESIIADLLSYEIIKKRIMEMIESDKK